MEDMLRQEMQRQLMLSAAGTAMFCAKCKGLLDFKSTAIVAVWEREKKNPTTRVFCTGCVGTATLKNLEDMVFNMGTPVRKVEVDTLDGTKTFEETLVLADLGEQEVLDI